MTNVDRWILPEGIDELLPDRAAVAERLRRDILDLFDTWGYQLVIPPLIEFTDSLLIGLGKDVDLQSFLLTDQLSGKRMAVRADITPQTARIDAHSLKVEGVNRLCYAGSVLHTRPKSLMASRCPIQVGAELYGDVSVSADTEIISLMLETLQVIDRTYSSAYRHANGSTDKSQQGGAGIHKLTLDLGHVAIYNVISEAVRSANPELQQDDLISLFDAMQRKSIPDLESIIPQLVKDKALAKKLYQLPSLCGDVSVLDEAKLMLSDLGSDVTDAIDQLASVASVITQRFDDVEVYFDLAELRGYEYHTGLVFAAYADGYGRALANGGRYDHIGKVFGSARPATGFNTDIKALIDLLGQDGASMVNDRASREVAIIAAPDNEDLSLWQSVCALRCSGETVVFAASHDLANYHRKLVKKDGHWVVESV